MSTNSTEIPSFMALSVHDKLTDTKRMYRELQAQLRESIGENEELSVLTEETVGRKGETRNYCSLSEQNTISLVCLVSELEISRCLLRKRLDQVEKEIATLESILQSSKGNLDCFEVIESHITDSTGIVDTTQSMISDHKRVMLRIKLILLQVGVLETTQKNPIASPTQLRDTSIYQDYETSITSNPQKKLCIRKGKWIKAYRTLELEDPVSGCLTIHGLLIRDYEKQCDNIVLLERERNAFLLKADQLSEQNVELIKRNEKLIKENEELIRNILEQDPDSNLMKKKLANARESRKCNTNPIEKA